MAEQTRSDIDVAAGPAEVMAVIADLEAYPEWANVKSTEVLESGADGRPSRVRFTLDAGVIKDSYVLEYSWSDDESVSWTLAEQGSVVSMMDGTYSLAGGSGSTVVTYELTVDVKIPMIGMLKRKAEKTIVETALKGLKKRVEGST